ncbi:MAG: permease [Desulfobacterales bacterium]|nr:permease [Desulfobacterales bacterium]
MKLLEIIKKNLFLIMIVIALLVLLILSPDKALRSLKNSQYYVIEMLKIMPVVLILTALIEAWVPRKTIMNRLGKQSKVKGALLSLVMGSVSAGPIYVAFPLCRTLYKKGASITNIVIIMSAWAVVKIPMLATEAQFLGASFMLVRWALTVLSIIAMALLVGTLVKRDDIPADDPGPSEDAVQPVVIIDEYCMGCELCAQMMPALFEMQGDKAVVAAAISRHKKVLLKALDVAEKCPGHAIVVNSGGKALPNDALPAEEIAG